MDRKRSRLAIILSVYVFVGLMSFIRTQGELARKNAFPEGNVWFALATEIVLWPNSVIGVLVYSYPYIMRRIRNEERMEAPRGAH